MTQTRYSTGTPMITVADLYKNMSEQTLRGLRWCWQVERVSAFNDRQELARIDERLRLIALELGSRGVDDDDAEGSTP